MLWTLYRNGAPFCTSLNQERAVETYWAMMSGDEPGKWALQRRPDM
jgi:hypothetical protein